MTARAAIQRHHELTGRGRRSIPTHCLTPMAVANARAGKPWEG